MILAFDTYYYDNKAKTVCVAFEHWEDSSPYKIYDEIFENIAEYVPGEFYKRELPCILSLLKKIQAELENIEAIVVDGFVFLDDDKKLGLGGHLYHALEAKIPIIGVAKTNFATIEQLKKPLLRGNSQKPLFVTAIGIDLNEATQKVQNMHGEFRLPTLLKYLDTLTKEK
jgi:exodeoxyribonuclease-5/deoxyribonuclease V